MAVAYLDSKWLLCLEILNCCCIRSWKHNNCLKWSRTTNSPILFVCLFQFFGCRRCSWPGCTGSRDRRCLVVVDGVRRKEERPTDRHLRHLSKAGLCMRSRLWRMSPVYANLLDMWSSEYTRRRCPSDKGTVTVGILVLVHTCIPVVYMYRLGVVVSWRGAIKVSIMEEWVNNISSGSRV